MVLMLVDWTRGLYTQSFARGRSQVNRTAFVAMWLLGFILINVIELAVLVLFLQSIQQLMIGAA
jgi:hypothetical protein